MGKNLQLIWKGIYYKGKWNFKLKEIFLWKSEN